MLNVPGSSGFIELDWAGVEHSLGAVAADARHELGNGSIFLCSILGTHT